MKKLWVLPLAALLCGNPVAPPQLKALIPNFKKGSCQEAALREFLLAFAYRGESRATSSHHIRRAEKFLHRCEESLLRSRLNELKNSSL